MKLLILQQHHTVNNTERHALHTYIQYKEGEPFVRLDSELGHPLHTLSGLFKHFVRIAVETDIPNADDYSSEYESDAFTSLKLSLEREKKIGGAFEFCSEVIRDLYDYPEMSEFGVWETHEYEIHNYNELPLVAAGAGHGLYGNTTTDATISRVSNTEEAA